MSQRRDRMNIAVSKEVAESLANIADELGMTQYALANQILGVGLELMRQGYSVSQIRELAQFYKVLMELETVPVPGRILDRMIVEIYKASPDAASKAWCEGGKMLAGYIKAVFGDLKAAAALAPYIAKMVPARRFDVKMEGDEFRVDTIGVGYSMESVEVTASAVRCLLEELGYTIEEISTAPGILRVKAKKK
ncbi:MAG: hypothetical protein ABWJ97_01780 [Thermoproteus sp.]